MIADDRKRKSLTNTFPASPQYRVDEKLDLPKIVISVFRFNDGNFSALSDFPNRHGDESPNFTPQTPEKISKNDPANCRPSPLPPPLPPNSKSLVFFADFCQPATALTLKARWRIWRILKWCPLQFLDIINHEESR